VGPNRFLSGPARPTSTGRNGLHADRVEVTIDIKGDRLHVQLSASQVRRRLKGLGYGVRKIQSAGRNEAIVIHTATGQHLRELVALLQDVIVAPPEQE